MTETTESVDKTGLPESESKALALAPPRPKNEPPTGILKSYLGLYAQLLGTQSQAIRPLF
jgi:hypothetical protein